MTDLTKTFPALSVETAMQIVRDFNFWLDAQSMDYESRRKSLITFAKHWMQFHGLEPGT